jgi:hypothetical protein
VVAGDQEQDRLAAVLVADVKVTETAEVAEGDATAGVEPVAANAVIDLRLGQRRRGFESGIVQTLYSAVEQYGLPAAS